jgi:hypothetical protein
MNQLKASNSPEIPAGVLGYSFLAVAHKVAILHVMRSVSDSTRIPGV